MIEDWEYQTENTALIPYDRVWPVFPDGITGHLYLRTKSDNLLSTVFCGRTTPNFDDFVSFLSSSKVTTQIYCLQEDGKPLEPIGYCFVHGADGEDGARMAQFGFCFFKEYWGRQELRDLVWLCLRYWFEVLKIEVLYGATLCDNFLARNFSRRFGFTEIAVLPKFLYRDGGRTDARLVYLEKGVFEQLYLDRVVKQEAA